MKDMRRADPNLLDYIPDIATYIEKNLKNNLSLEQISHHLYISRFYMDRIFSAITGHKLMNYVTGRKLMSSLNELLNTEMRILDIAQEYGFNFEYSYIRAFKRAFHITPGEYRRVKCELNTTPAINMDSLTAISDTSILVKPTMVVKPAFYVIGNRCHVERASNLTEYAIDFVDNKTPLIKNISDNHTYYGHVLYDGAYSYYTACAQVAQDARPPAGLIKFQIPTNKYWVFKYIGLHSNREIAYTEFAHMFDAVYRWFNTVKQTRSSIYHLEKVDDNDCTQTYCELDLYYPISEESI
jgi:AraC family transcriptional regulator